MGYGLRHAEVHWRKKLSRSQDGRRCGACVTAETARCWPKSCRILSTKMNRADNVYSFLLTLNKLCHPAAQTYLLTPITHTVGKREQKLLEHIHIGNTPSVVTCSIVPVFLLSTVFIDRVVLLCMPGKQQKGS